MQHVQQDFNALQQEKAREAMRHKASRFCCKCCTCCTLKINVAQIGWLLHTATLERKLLLLLVVDAKRGPWPRPTANIDKALATDATFATKLKIIAAQGFPAFLLLHAGKFLLHVLHGWAEIPVAPAPASIWIRPSLAGSMRGVQGSARVMNALRRSLR